MCFAIAGKDKHDQYFVFTGDFSPFFKDGIQNEFQKKLFSSYGFTIRDLCEYSFIGRILKYFSGSVSVTFRQFINHKSLLFRLLSNILLRKYIRINKEGIVGNVLRAIKPDVLLTDQSITSPNYIPEIFRKMAKQMDIAVYLFSHGAAGGLHSTFSEFTLDSYEGYIVFACSKLEPKANDSNRIILGDASSSYPYVHFLNKLNIYEIHFLDNRKYKIGFIVGGVIFTSTNGWHIMQEIIIDYSENPDVAMVLKLHPREAPYIDLRMLKQFNNLLIVGRETDRSRVSKWADIVVCSDHCSTIFEPMILGKKVVAVEGRHIPKYKNFHSPIKFSSVMHISMADEFELDKIPDADPKDPVTNTVAWGENGKVDLAEIYFEYIDSNL